MELFFRLLTILTFKDWHLELLDSINHFEVFSSLYIYYPKQIEIGFDFVNFILMKSG